MPALARLLVAATVVLALAAGSASAEERMWIGFHDDPMLRYGNNRHAELGKVRAANATIVRTLVEWRSVAPKRPKSATNSFDPTYRFADLDEFVRNTQQRGMEVLMTIWGTPKWANGGKGPAYLPKKMADFQNFARALATRYNGRRAGYPFVRFYGIWNESNLGNFLAPQFDTQGKIVSPAAYAKLAAAGYAGIKAGSPKALVAIGETSSNGKDKPKQGSTDSTTPGTFAKMVAQANKKLKFDAWAQHPYPVPVNQGPAQKVRYPNVAFSTMKQFESDLDKWFGRKNIPVWITEYGNETKPGEPKGVTEAQQAAYVPQAIAFAKKDPRIPMFIWFVFRDSARQPLAERRLSNLRRGQAGGGEVGELREGRRQAEREGEREGRHCQPARQCQLPRHVHEQRAGHDRGRHLAHRPAATATFPPPRARPRHRSRSTARSRSASRAWWSRRAAPTEPRSPRTRLRRPRQTEDRSRSSAPSRMTVVLGRRPVYTPTRATAGGAVAGLRGGERLKRVEP